MRSGAIFRAKAKSGRKTLGVGRRWRETPWRFNEAVHPSISPMLRLFRFGVSQKKQQKPKKKITELPHFIPFLISLQPLWVGPENPSSTLPPYHIRKFLSLDRFHIRQLCGHDDLTATFVFGAGVRFPRVKVFIQGMYNKDILLMVQKSGQKPPGM